MGCEVAAVPDRGLLIQGIRGGHRFEIALIKLWRHFDDLHTHGLPLGRKGLAVAKQQGHVPAALPERRQGVAVDCGVRIGDFRQALSPHGHGFCGIHNVGAPLGRVLFECLHRSGQFVNRRGPLRFIWIGRVHQHIEGVHVIRAQRVEVEIVLSSDFIFEFPYQHQPALVPHQRIKIEALLQVRLGQLEVGLSIFASGFKRHWQGRQAHAGIIDEHGFAAGGIVQRHAGRRHTRLRDRLLVQHAGTGLPAHRRQAALGQGQSLAHIEGRRTRGPRRVIEHRKGRRGHGVSHIRAAGIFGPQVGQHGPNRGLRRHIGKHKIRAHRVVKLHSQ